MKFPFLLTSIIGASAIILTGMLLNAKANTNSALESHDEPLCEMQLGSGKTQDLSSICGKKADNTPSQLNPNTPIVIPIIKSPTPSTLWGTLPDLPNPPEEGKTKPVSPSSTQPPAQQPGSKPFQPSNN
jgi:hypothetical protein